MRICLIIVLLTWGQSAYPQEGCTEAFVSNLHHDYWLNVRKEPNTTSLIVTQLPRNEKVTILYEVEGATLSDPDLNETTDIWYGIETMEGMRGHVSSLYLSCASNEEENIENPIEESTGDTGECQTSRRLSQWPVPSSRYISQGFRRPITYQTCGFHTGLDIGAQMGKRIVAPGYGKVVHVGPIWLNGQGKGVGEQAVIIDHGNGMFSTYGHNSLAFVEEGDCVTPGQPIALIGSEGYSTGPHLHFEVLKDRWFTGDWSRPFHNVCGAYVDPAEFYN